MTTYAVGDIQGCYRELSELLEKLAFGAADSLWVLGDLVNRGPDSLAVLQLLYSMRAQLRIVLGNHDLHLLAMHYGGHSPNRSDTVAQVLAAADCDELLDWLRRQPLLVQDPALGYVMTHAGIPHIWSLAAARGYAAEVEQMLRGENHQCYFEQLYGNRPDRWQDSLVGMDRLRMITNYFTRMRLLREDGTLNFSHKGALDDAPSDWLPWYQLRDSAPQRLLFGHWAALEGVTGREDIIALDTGCVWGRALTALNLHSGALTRVQAAGA
ncbi:MAG: symmetrical bis(5'-nucleosyl)-tetraphosphatase [Pseudomonadales bacterium]